MFEKNNDPRCVYRQLIHNQLLDCIDLVDKDLFVQLKKNLKVLLASLPEELENE